MRSGRRVPRTPGVRPPCVRLFAAGVQGSRGRVSGCCPGRRPLPTRRRRKGQPASRPGSRVRLRPAGSRLLGPSSTARGRWRPRRRPGGWAWASIPCRRRLRPVPQEPGPTPRRRARRRARNWMSASLVQLQIEEFDSPPLLRVPHGDVQHLVRLHDPARQRKVASQNLAGLQVEDVGSVA